MKEVIYLSEMNYHISAEHRTKWNKGIADLASHKNDKDLGKHIPTPPSDGRNYALVSVNGTLQWIHNPI